ncbi:oxidoreductase [Gordonia sp. CPCC 205333]|uniref:oxidoreductase n=1 Tax=Gordonia sp. CPCC 205333 TaxID=3140790 RepID=UPI003AF33E3A
MNTSKQWSESDLPEFTGRSVVVTGGNSGLGLVVASELARAGASVTLAVRDVDKGSRAAAKMSGVVRVRELDLADLSSVRAFAAQQNEPIDVLVNNAGVMMTPLGRTADGFERQIGTNHLGHFALTNLLLEYITDRVVTVSSNAHQRGGIDLDDLTWNRRKYSRSGAYAQSKLANLLFSNELQRRLLESGSVVRSVAAHPGWAATNLQSHSGSALGGALMGIGNRFISQSAQMGALPALFAISQELSGGSYIGPNGRGGLRGYPHSAAMSAAARDAVLAARLWDLSASLTDTDFPNVEASAAVSPQQTVEG